MRVGSIRDQRPIPGDIAQRLDRGAMTLASPCRVDLGGHVFAGAHTLPGRDASDLTTSTYSAAASRNNVSISGQSGRVPSPHCATTFFRTLSIRLKSAIFARTSAR